jgi:hypothetical protein
MEVSDQLHASAALSPGKETPYPLNRRLYGTQNCPESFRHEISLLPLEGIEPLFLRSPASIEVTIFNIISGLSIASHRYLNLK